MRKLRSIIGSILVIGMLIGTPILASAHHGGSGWYTDRVYNECLDGSYYQITERHRHVDGVRIDDTIRTLILEHACPMVNSQTE